MKSKEKEEKEVKYKIDWARTLLDNSFWIIMEILIFVLAFVALSYSKNLTDQVMILMYGVFCLWFILKLLVWNGHPQLQLKRIYLKK